MKLLKNSNILFISLTLILSLISFAEVSAHTPRGTLKTTLVVDNLSEDTSCDFHFKNITKAHYPSCLKFYSYRFTTFQVVQNLNVLVAFKSNSQKTIGVISNQIHTIIYSTLSNKTLYQNSIL